VRGLLLFLCFQAAWWACAFLARDGHGALAALSQLLFAALVIAVSPKRRASRVLLAAIAVVTGIVVDGSLRQAGFIRFDPGVDGAPSPPFMMALWVAFSCALPVPLLSTRPLLGALVGAVGGALSYRGAAGFGVLHVDGSAAVVAIAVCWGIAFPLLGAIAVALDDDDANRRARTVTRTFILLLVLVLTAPLWGLIAVGVDVVRRLTQKTPVLITLRLMAFGTAFLAVETWGLLRMIPAGLLLSGQRLIEATYRHQASYTKGLFTAVRACFNLDFVVDGAAAAVPGPVIVLVRHASIIDTLLPSVFLTQQLGLRLRFVLKKELRDDPCLDIAGDRIPNFFVPRDGEDTAAAVAGVGRLASHLGDEGVLIYPEGTRFSARKRQEILKRLAEKNPPLAATAEQWTSVLPPRTAGFFAALDAAHDADVVFVAHHGLEGFSHVKDIWSGALFGRTVRVRCWRVPRREIPEGEARLAWLHAQWTRVDAFAREMAS